MPAQKIKIIRAAYFAVALGLGGLFFSSPGSAAENDEQLIFTADEVAVLKEERVVTARGRVKFSHKDYHLEADIVTFNELTGEVLASGNVKLTDPRGNALYLDEVKLDKELREGFIKNLRFVFEDGSRLAARDGEMVGEKIILNYAVFTPCVICDDHPDRPPSWQVRAVKVTLDKEKKRIYYKNATLEILGVPVAFLPYLSHPDPSVKRASGFLTPETSISKELGFVLKVPYYIAASPSLDFTVTPIITTKEGLVLAAEVRKHLGFGIIRSEGSITYTDIPDTFGNDTGSKGIRGHIFANGTFNHSENFRTKVQFQLTSDDTYLKRYGFSNVDTLKSELLSEYFDNRSYYSLRTLWFQGLRAEDVQGLTAFALPLITLNFVSEPDRIGGVFNVEFNALALQRTDGMDSSRATIQGSYEIPYTTRHGIILKLGVHFRGDVYNISNSDRPDFAFFRGQNGSYSRFLPHLTASFEWPFVKTGKRTQQILTPIVTFVAAPSGGNPVGISNEDSRAFELSDSNILSGNRMPGFDLWEGGSRINFGFKWLIISKNFTIDTFFGESYRFSTNPTDADDIRFAPGSGLSTSLSDLVTRVDITIKGKIRISNRMRFDESSFRVRRNEIDANIYIQNAMFGIGYYKLNRGLQIQGLENREEIRIYGQYSFKTNWKIFGDITRNLTTTGATVFQGVGISYSDDCVELSVAWRKSFTTDRDISPGTSILFRLRLKHLG